MSIAEIERFTADLKSNEALRAEVGKVQAETSQATPMDRVVAFAATKGYAFTTADVKEYAKAMPLTDAELAGVAGGVQQIDFGLFKINIGGASGISATTVSNETTTLTRDDMSIRNMP